MQAKELDQDLIFLANYNSFSGETGNVIERTYKMYVDMILNWPSGNKQKMLDEIYERFTVLLADEVMEVRT